MRHVLDLDGDWFAMPSGVPDGGGTIWTESGPVPRVGDIIQNVRTMFQPHRYTEAGARGVLTRNPGRIMREADGDWYVGEFVWADPPFLRIAEVLPIHGGDHRDWNAPNHVLCYGDGPHRIWRRTGSPHEPWRTEPVDLPSAQPGGWAVQVEPLEFTRFSLRQLTNRPPVLDGPPLNGAPWDVENDLA